jgi:hypothetical protein
MQKAIGRKASNQIEQIAPPLGKRAAEGQLYSICIVGNVEQRRTEAEISNGEGVVLAVVYETSDGWHTDIVVEHFGEAASDLQTALDHAKENLSHYVNRRGKNAPENATQAVYSL